MLRTGMKTRLINKCQVENTEPKVTDRIDNEVHPLHWATSLGPSPMGTDPINGFKMVQMFLETTSATAEIECWTETVKSSRPPL